MRTALPRVAAILAVLLPLAACGSKGSSVPDLDFSDAVDPGAGQAQDVPDETASEQDVDGGEGVSGTDPGGPPDPGADVPFSPFTASPELFLRILSPSAEGATATAGSIVSLAGVMFGGAESLSWDGPGGGGTLVATPFWSSGPLPLQPGDNRFTVTATSGDRTASDTLVVTYNPGIYFTQRPVARPDVILVGESQDVIFTVRVPATEGASTNVGLWSAKDDLSPDKRLGTMEDDGEVDGSGDEIVMDGVYTWRARVKCLQEGSLHYRASLDVKAANPAYTAYSVPVTVECVEPIGKVDCQEAVDAETSAVSLFNQKKTDLGEEGAKAAVVEALKANNAVEWAGVEPGGHGVSIRFKSGLLGVVPLAPAGLRAGTDPVAGAGIASKKASVLSPYNTDFGGDDETVQAAQLLGAKQCPTYDLSGPHQGGHATLARMREAMGAGILVLATHGDSFFRDLPADVKTGYGWSHLGSQEALLFQEPFSCSQFLAKTPECETQSDCPEGTDCVITSTGMGSDYVSLQGVCVDRTQADLRRGRAAIAPDGVAVLPSFVDRYGRTGMPDSVVYLGACRSIWNGTLAAAFLGAGAQAVAGWSGYVASSFAAAQADPFFQALIGDGKTVGGALPADVPDPENPGTHLVLLGARDLSVTASNIVNEGFERGDLTGWTSEGDGRVISKLGSTRPVSGKFMGIISTGLGYTVENGLIEQTFCIPAGITSLTFYWKYYSDEFTNFCGSEFQDTFWAHFVTEKGGDVPLVKLAVDDLCDPEDCSGCCASGQCVGLEESDVQFDKEETKKVPKWQKATKDVTGLAGGGPVTLSFFTTDKGDSIYDTVVLIDAVKFQ